jgi:hypothetical protein
MVEENIIKEGHWKYVLLISLIIMGFFFFNDYFKKDYMPPVSSDFNDNHVGGFIVLKESLVSYHSLFAFWNPFILGGTNFLAKSTTPDLLYPLDWIIFLISPIWFSLKIMIILNLIIGAIGIYFIAYNLIKDKKSAVIAALFYTFNGFTITLLIKGWSDYIRAYCLIPWIIFLLILAFKSKKWVLYSLISSILLAMQVFAGGPNTFLWTLILVCFFLAFKLIESLFLKKNPAKIIIIGCIVMLFSASLSAIRTIPEEEYLSNYSDRAQGLPYEQSLWQKITFNCKEEPNYCFWGLIEPSSFPFRPDSGFGYKIGLIGLILSLFAIVMRWKNKYVLMLTILSLLSIIISLGTPLYYLLFKYAPGFSAHRYPHRALVLLSFAISILVAYGYNSLIEKIRQKYNLSGLKEKIFFIIFILVLIFDLIMLGYPLSKQVDLQQEINNNDLYNYIASQNGTFRTHVQDIFSNNRGLTHLFIPLGIQFTYGYEQTFNTEYLPVFLSVANSDPAKLFGILNVKYVTSSKEINITGYRFIRRFNYSKYTQSEELNQTYLYENDLFLPRYFIIKNAILVVGDDDAAKQTMYWLMVNDNFDPKKSIIIKGKSKISDYSQEDLMKFKAIVLTKGSVDENSVQNLKKYVEKGNILLPDITRNKQSVEDSEIASMFKDLSNIQYEEIKPSYYSPDKVIFDLKDKIGFVFASEQYSIYPGWEAFVDEKEADLLRANGVFSAIYVDGNKNLAEFEYKSQTFFYGAVISSISLIVIICYIIYLLIKLSNNKKNENPS